MLAGVTIIITEKKNYQSKEKKIECDINDSGLIKQCSVDFHFKKIFDDDKIFFPLLVFDPDTCWSDWTISFQSGTYRLKL